MCPLIFAVSGKGRREKEGKLDCGKGDKKMQ